MRFVNLLGYREITMKCDTEPTIVAFRNGVAANCKVEVTVEHAARQRIGWDHIESRREEPLNDDSLVMP